MLCKSFTVDSRPTIFSYPCYSGILVFSPMFSRYKVLLSWADISEDHNWSLQRPGAMVSGVSWWKPPLCWGQRAGGGAAGVEMVLCSELHCTHHFFSFFSWWRLDFLFNWGESLRAPDCNNYTLSWCNAKRLRLKSLYNSEKRKRKEPAKWSETDLLCLITGRCDAFVRNWCRLPLPYFWEAPTSCRLHAVCE